MQGLAWSLVELTCHFVQITEEDLARARQLVVEEKVKGRVIEWRDKSCKGLVLRITPTATQWYIRFRETSVKLESWMTVEIARHVADIVDTARHHGMDLKRCVTTYLEKRERWVDEKEACFYALNIDQRPESPSGSGNASAGNTWTWGKLVEKFLEQKLPGLKEKYRDQYQYASYLRHPAFDIIKDRTVSGLDIVALETCRNEMRKVAARSAVKRAVQQGKAMLDWAWQNEAAESGLGDPVKWWERWSETYKSKKRDRTPTIDELGRTLAIAESYRTLSEEEHETSAGTLGALWAVVLTAQRSGPLVQTKRDRLFDHADLKGWKVFNWTAEEMKGGRDGGRLHSLPVPPRALAILNRYRKEAGKESEWMFPSRKRGPVTQSALNRLFYRLQGNVADQKIELKPDRPGKPGPKPQPRKALKNLFTKFSIEPWTPHDTRRTLTTFLSDMGLGGAASAILGHKIEGEKVPERELTAKVTDAHYNTSQKIALKAEGMAVWVDAIIKAYLKASKEIDVGSAGNIRHGELKSVTARSPNRRLAAKRRQPVNPRRHAARSAHSSQRRSGA